MTPAADSEGRDKNAHARGLIWAFAAPWSDCAVRCLMWNFTDCRCSKAVFHNAAHTGHPQHAQSTMKSLTTVLSISLGKTLLAWRFILEEDI